MTVLLNPEPEAGLHHERVARMLWSHLAEPSDQAARHLIARLGPQRALAHVMAGHTTNRRWNARLETWSMRRARDLLADPSIRLLIPSDGEWPSGLQHLPDPPVCLWVKGNPDLDRACSSSVALVGARSVTSYGQHVAGSLASGLADREIAVVSGAAFGVDAAAHRGALAAGGITIAVVAQGIDRVYPSAHDRLYRQIAEEGCIVTESAPGTTPAAWRFLQRNRLIAALSSATVVIEAAWRSGAISTAMHAANLNRPLGAVPGPITSAMSAGCHRLLREAAAIPITDATEVAELIQPIDVVSHKSPDATTAAKHHRIDEESVVLQRVFHSLPLQGPATVEQLACSAGVELCETVIALSRLHRQELVDTDGGHPPRWWRR